MAFDAGMLSCVLHEVGGELTDGKIEKIYMPQKDMAVLQIKKGREPRRLLINAGPTSPRICITAEKADNPAVPPMFCMMLRKHLGGAKLTGVEQLGFERAARFAFETYDEMGFRTTKYLIAEIMGKYSNLILADAEDKMIGILRPVDFTTSQKRQLLPGMRYEAPPKQEKSDPLVVSHEEFRCLMAAFPPEMAADKAILASFAGIASPTAREIVYRTAGAADASLGNCGERLWDSFSSYAESIRTHTATPFLLLSPEGSPREYSYMEIRQYGDSYRNVRKDSFSELIDSYFAERSRQDTLRQRASDVLHLLGAAEARIQKKLALQTNELADCDAGEKYRLYADLITANIYRLSRGMQKAAVENYYDDGAMLEIPLDVTLTPAQNAQKYYKKYNKSKSARLHLTEQMEHSRAELAYIQSVLDALTRAENERDLNDIRDELYHSGYASRMKSYAVRKNSAPSYLRFRTDSGRMVYCGKNNTANDYVTTKLAARSDWWFHVKNQPGSHVILQCAGAEDEPSELDFTQAAEIAACYSKAAEGAMVPVDYTLVRHVKKPSGSKPGFVIYTTNWTAYVTPDKNDVERMRIK